MESIIPLIIVIAVSLVKFLMEQRNKEKEQHATPNEKPHPSPYNDNDWNWEQEVKKVTQQQTKPFSSDEALLAGLYHSEVQAFAKSQSNIRQKRNAAVNAISKAEHDKTSYGIGHEGIVDSPEDLKRAFIASEILKRKF